MPITSSARQPGLTVTTGAHGRGNSIISSSALVSSDSPGRVRVAVLHDQFGERLPELHLEVLLRPSWGPPKCRRPQLLSTTDQASDDGEAGHGTVVSAATS